MGLKYFETDIKNIGKQEFLRPNFGYRYFFDIKNAEIYKNKKQIKLKHVLKDLPTIKMAKGDLIEEDILIDICNIERRFNNLINLKKVNKIGSDKNILQNGDIVIPKMQPQMGNIFLNTKHERYLASTELIEYSIAKKNNPIFIYYLFTTNKFLFNLSKLESGKTHRRVNSIDLFKIKIPLISKFNQDQIVAKIEPIEYKIQQLKSKIKEPVEVINKVFAREFGFDLEKFEVLKKEKIYYLEFNEFSNNKDLRQSVKFHNKAGIFVLSEFKKLTNKKIKDFILEPIVLGKGVSPKNYDENGEYYYISMANIKTWSFRNEDIQTLSLEYSKKNLKKTVKKDDILIARSGEGTIGKCALIDNEDIKGIFADFTMRIRFENYSPYFAYYYFRTDYFQYLVEVNKKGLGNNTNIFPSQIQEFPLLDISLEGQQRIVDEIKTELDKQEDIKKQIEQERNKIDEIIESILK